MVKHKQWAIYMVMIFVMLQAVFGTWTAERVLAAGTVPSIVSVSPSDNGTNVQLTAPLIVTFDREVKKGIGAIEVRGLVDNALFESYAVESSNYVTISGSNRTVVTITPSKPFAAGTSYYVTIQGGAFASVSENADNLELSGTAAWNFSTVSATDTTAPQLIASNPFVPANSATGVSTASTLTIQFSEPVYTNSGFITLQNANKASDVQSIPVTSSALAGSSTTTITITPPTALKTNSTYDVLIPSTAFVDAAGNRFAGISSQGTWRFTTLPPVLGNIALAPADDQAGVEVGAKLTLTFGSNVTANSGTITIRKIADNTVLQTIGVTSGSVQISGNKVTITPSTLPANTGVYVLIDAGAFRDAATGTQIFEGMLDAGEWNFTTGNGNDTTAPYLTEQTPLTTSLTTSSVLKLTFNEPVYQGSGSIVLKSSPSGTVIASIPVTDLRVTGGGTNIITVSPNVTLTNGTTYYVQIGAQAFRDASGNNYAGIASTDTTSWRFIVTPDAVQPTVVTLEPSNGATSIAVSGVTYSIIFSEPIQVQDGTGASFKRTTTSGAISTTSATMVVDPNNNRRVLITPSTQLAANMTYYMEIEANSVADLAGNNFSGILNTYQWRFQTSSLSGAPTVQSLALSGSSRIAITYNQALDTSSVPSIANFYVTVNGSYRSVTAVQVTGQIVYLTLQSAVVSGQEVRLSYTVGANPIRNQSLTNAASLSSQSVTNVADTTAPRPISGTVAGNTITMIFSEELNTINASGYGQFLAYVNGSYRSVTAITGSGSVMYMTLSGNEVTAGQTVTLTYSKGSYPIYDMSNNPMASFSSFQVTNGVDTAAPLLQSVKIAGNKLVLIYNETLNSTQVPKVSAYSVMVDSVARSVTQINVTGYQVELTLSTAVSAGQSILVSYTRQSPYLVDVAGNPAESFANQGASGAASTLTLYGAIAKGSTVTLNYSAQLDSSFTPTASQFSVKADGSTRQVSSVQISYSSLVLTLVTPVSIGDVVKVTYNYATTSGASLRSTGGTLADSFTDMNAANQTTWSDDPTSDFESVSSGIGLKKQTATLTPDTTPGGKSVNRYALPESKVKSAYAMIDSIGGTPRLVFTVPDTEAGAAVSVPMSALKNALSEFPSASFMVSYKGYAYELPLSVINTTSTSGSLLVTIDPGANKLTTPLTNAISAAGSKVMGDAVNFDTFIVTDNSSTKLNDFGGYVTRTIPVSSTLETRQTAVVWYDSTTGKISYAPTHVETSGGTSVVTFQRKGNSAYAVIKGNVVFSDLGAHWARNDILLMANKYIVEGRTSSTFQPTKTITRAEFAAFISKGLGLTGDKEAALKFPDVTASNSAAAYIGAAAKAGIVNGMTDGNFKPNSPVTREQMASMMIRAAEVAGKKSDLSQNAATILRKFKDSAKIGTWAQVDVAKSVQMGIINGMSNGNFGAKSNATRAEAVVMIERLLMAVNLLDA